MTSLLRYAASRTAITSAARPAHLAPLSASFTTAAAVASEKENVLNKAYIVEKVRTEHDVKLADAKRIVDTVFDSITEGLVKGQKVRISGFGKFESKTQQARIFTTPQGSKVATPEKNKVKFTALTSLKEQVAKSS